jgi:sporulation protein YlmC with PRC-barrel domain
MRTQEIDLGLGILDHQLLDSEGRRCGKVDDLEIEGIRGDEPYVSEILVGVAAWRPRGPLARLGSLFAPRRAVHVPWSDVDDVASAVQLRRTARELRLGRGDDRARRVIERIPGSQ